MPHLWSGLRRPVLVKINYQRKQATIDVSKVSRVFSNITANAVQAMGFQGQLWFRTREFNASDVPFLEICIGNDGPLIEEKDLAKIFGLFFTKQKKGGTGLGLAIAEKIVLAHGGKIWCTSSKNSGVEFHFTLPISEYKQDSIAAVQLPTHSSQIDVFNLAGLSNFEEKPPLNNEAPLRALPLEIALIDDNAFVLDSWENKLKDITINSFESADAFFDKCEKDHGFLNRIACVVTDYFLEGRGSGPGKTGIDLAMAVRRSKTNMPIFLASDASYRKSHDGWINRNIGKTIPSLHEIIGWIDEASMVNGRSVGAQE